MHFALFCATLAVSVSTASLQVRQSTGPTVNFGDNTGSPNHLASGILYGLPDNTTQIPSSWLSGFGFNYGRAGGAQVGHGWCWDKANYESRFASAYDNYVQARAHGGGFVLLLNDLWGFDTTQNSSSLAPGDNGDWTFYQQFLDAVIADIKQYGMQEGLVIDIWNEPDGDSFWGRSIQQWLEMWGLGYHEFKEAFGSDVLTSGPTTAGAPSTTNDWWTEWAPFVIANNSIPDQYVWHLEYTGATLDGSAAGLEEVMQSYSLPTKQININEYAIYSQQVPAGSAFWISQLERHNAIGLRGNWLSGTQLHDFAASLLSKPDQSDYAATGYYPNGDWWTYNYYVQNMTGNRVSTTASSDGQLDAYAVVGSDDIARVLLGCSPPTTGTYTVSLENMTALGLPSSGTLEVETLAFYVNSSDAHFGYMGAPTSLGYYGHAYSNNAVSLAYDASDETSAYAWQFAIKSE